MPITNFTKWFYCWIEWEDKNGNKKLSVIPWHILPFGLFANKDFKWQWIPPWQVKSK